MKNSQKGFITWGFVAAVAAVALAGGVFLTIQRNENGQKESGWKSYIVNEYQFNYPSSWKPVVISGQASSGKEIVNFTDSKDKKVAILECSIREVGYGTAWNLSSKDKRLDVGNTKHGVTLWSGTPKNGTGLGPLFIVYMYRNTFPDTWGNNADDHAHSCELSHFGDAGDDAQVIGQTFGKIFDSVSLSKNKINTSRPADSGNVSNVNADWKKYRNDTYGFELQYPSDWEVSNANMQDGSVGFGPPLKETDMPVGGGVSVKENTANATLEGMLQAAKKISYYHSFETLNIGGQPAFRYQSNEFARTEAVIVYKGRIYSLTNEVVTKPEILSTFKFVK